MSGHSIGHPIRPVLGVGIVLLAGYDGQKTSHDFGEGGNLHHLMGLLEHHRPHCFQVEDIVSFGSDSPCFQSCHHRLPLDCLFDFLPVLFGSILVCQVPLLVSLLGRHHFQFQQRLRVVGFRWREREWWGYRVGVVCGPVLLGGVYGWYHSAFRLRGLTHLTHFPQILMAFTLVTVIEQSGTHPALPYLLQRPPSHLCQVLPPLDFIPNRPLTDLLDLDAGEVDYLRFAYGLRTRKEQVIQSSLLVLQHRPRLLDESFQLPQRRGLLLESADGLGVLVEEVVEFFIGPALTGGEGVAHLGGLEDGPRGEGGAGVLVELDAGFLGGSEDGLHDKIMLQHRQGVGVDGQVGRVAFNQNNIIICSHMVKVNILAGALRSMVNAERKGKKQVLLRPSSKVLLKFLRIMQRNNYIGEFQIIDDHRSKKIVVELIGRINKCGVISPRYDIPLTEFEKWTSNILPSRQFGHLVVSTNQGIFTHEEARERHIGGKIIGFFY